MIPEPFIIVSEDNEKQMLRLIQQYLTDHGYQDVALTLQERSSVRMEDESMNDLREYMLQGDFSQARRVLKGRPMITGEAVKQIEYLMYEQEYLEMLEKGSKVEAVNLLQQKMMPRVPEGEARQRLYFLARLILCGGKAELREAAQWKGGNMEGRRDLLDRLQNMMPPTEMLPPHRLEKLVKQSLAYQAYNCRYHNTQLSDYSLLEDHQCARQQMIPTKCIGVLTKHKDEVWLLKFSPLTGTKFATIGKDCILYLWMFTKLTSKTQKQTTKYKVKCTHEIRGHSKQINALNWSPDESMLITASNDATCKVWCSKTGQCLVDVTRHQDSVTAAAFVGNSRFITGGVDKLLILWDIVKKGSESVGRDSYEAVEIARVETRNYLDIAVSQSRFVTMGQNHFQVFNLPQGSTDFQLSIENPDLHLEHDITDTVTSIALSKGGRFLLANVSLKAPRLELFDLSRDKRAELLRRFKGGHEQTMFVLRCAFGGANEAFVLCGSEDASITIWSRDKGEVVAKIPSSHGHTQVVNSVSWNPVDPLVFASTSDDQTIRFWGIETQGQCEIVQDNKEIKKVDILRSGGGPINGRQSPAAGGARDQDEDIEEDIGDEDSDEEDEYDEEMLDEEQEEEQYHPRRAVLQSTRVARRRSVGEPADQEGEEEDEESDWVESSQL